MQEKHYSSSMLSPIIQILSRSVHRIVFTYTRTYAHMYVRMCIFVCTLSFAVRTHTHKKGYTEDQSPNTHGCLPDNSLDCQVLYLFPHGIRVYSQLSLHVVPQGSETPVKHVHTHKCKHMHAVKMYLRMYYDMRCTQSNIHMYYTLTQEA